MSQLASAAKPGRTARQLKNIRETRKVKGAIRWHERQRERRQKIIQERHDDKQVFKQVRQWHVENVSRPINEARKNLKQDYELGPLRPNRAVGQEAEKYGLLGIEQLTRKAIPVETQKRVNEAREARGLEPVYPLVVKDQKYFPIVRDDRVMVIKGPEKGKIGVVQDVMSGTHEVVVKGINKRFADASLFATQEDEIEDVRREIEVPLTMEDVRLVTPYQISTTDKDGNQIQTWTDVVVDNVLLERHTTGIDPFTKIDYGTREFPEEHRFDPETGFPVFNRYIAGTRRRIQWPWETVLPEQEDKSEKIAYSSGSNKSLIGKLKTPIETAKSWIKSSKSKDDNEQSTELTEEELAAQHLQAKLDQVNQVPELPRSAPVHLPADHEDDTGRNKAEPSPNTSSFYPTLVYPPFPRQLAPEIQTHAQEVEAAERSEKQDWYENKKELSAEERTRRKAAKAERLRPKGIPETMKTPLQLRWEVERRQKLEQREKAKVDRNALMIALGAHIDAKKAARISVKVGSELD